MLLLAACSDYDVQKQGDEPGFDTGDSGFDLDTDTATDAVETDDGSTTVPECPSQDFPPESLDIDESCTGGATVGSFTPVVEWQVGSFSEESSSTMVMAMPVVISLTDDDGDGDADDDDVPDVVFPTYVGSNYSSNGVLRALSGDDGRELWANAGSGVGGSAELAAADLDGDGFPEIVGATSTGRLLAFSADGSELWQSDPFSTGAPTTTAPAIADMDADGSPEIVAGSTIFDADGNVLEDFSGPSGAGNVYGATSFPADLDEDGVMELVAGGAVHGFDGSTWFSGGDGNPAVADFDGDGVPEIVLTNSGEAWLLDLDGDELWRVRVSSSTAGPPTIADYDGDGLPELGVAGLSTYTVVDGDGTVLWQNSTTDGSSGVTGSAVFDFEGDGVAEAVYADELAVWAFSGPDGAVKLSSSDHSSWTVIEYAPIVDVDGDGQAEIVVPNCEHPSYATVFTGITVLGDADGSWRPGRKIWNQHAFHLTNIEDDGSVPVHEEPHWKSYNSFRSGDTTPVTGAGAANLKVRILDSCTDECAEGRMSLWFSVGNDGTAEVDEAVGVRVEVESSTGWQTMSELSLSGPFAAGDWGASVEVELSGLPAGPLTGLRVTVDPEDARAECDEDDNVAELYDQLCG